MIIFRVAMGRGLLKETVKEIDTMLVFAKPDTATVVDSEKGRGVPMTIHEIDIDGSLSGPGTQAASSGTSVNEHTGTVGNAC
jgi:hypothetical protein